MTIAHPDITPHYTALKNLAAAVASNEALPADAPANVVEAHEVWIEEAEQSYLLMLTEGDWK